MTNQGSAIRFGSGDRFFIIFTCTLVSVFFVLTTIQLEVLGDKIDDLEATQAEGQTMQIAQAKAQALSLKTACPTTTDEFFRDYVVGGSVSDWTLHRDNNTPYTKFTFVKREKGDVKMIIGAGISGTSTMLYPAYQPDISQALYVRSGAQLTPVSNGTTYGCYNIE